MLNFKFISKLTFTIFVCGFVVCYNLFSPNVYYSNYIYNTNSYNRDNNSKDILDLKNVYFNFTLSICGSYNDSFNDYQGCIYEEINNTVLNEIIQNYINDNLVPSFKDFIFINYTCYNESEWHSCIISSKYTYEFNNNYTILINGKADNFYVFIYTITFLDDINDNGYIYNDYDMVALNGYTSPLPTLQFTFKTLKKNYFFVTFYEQTTFYSMTVGYIINLGSGYQNIQRATIVSYQVFDYNYTDYTTISLVFGFSSFIFTSTNNSRVRSLWLKIRSAWAGRQKQYFDETDEERNPLFDSISV